MSLSLPIYKQCDCKVSIVLIMISDFSPSPNTSRKSGYFIASQ